MIDPALSWQLFALINLPFATLVNRLSVIANCCMKCVKFVHFFFKAFPQSFQAHILLLMLMMLSRKVDRQTPLASAPPVILILIASDPSLVHTLIRIFIWPTSARNILIVGIAFLLFKGWRSCLGEQQIEPNCWSSHQMQLAYSQCIFQKCA